MFDAPSNVSTRVRCLGGSFSSTMGATLDDDPADHAMPAVPAPLDGVRVVAFDLDSTLVDIVHVKRRAAEAAAWALADAGLDVNPARAAPELLRVAFRVGIDRDDVVEHYLEQRLGRGDPRLAAIGRHAWDRAEDQSAHPYPRAQKTLLELACRGYTLALITDAPRHRAMRRLQAARLLPFFTEVVTLEDSSNGKANAEPYERAFLRLGAHPAEVAMVGDNPRRDVGQAKALGCRTILAAYGLQQEFASEHPDHQPDRSIRWLDELLTLLPPRGGWLERNAFGPARGEAP